MNNQKKFKQPSKRHQPRGLNILYEDRDIIVVNKVSGLLTVSTEKIKEATAYFLLTDYVRKGNSKSKNRIFIVHRLDKDTSGILVFAKTEMAKRYLQNEWHNFKKSYFAVVVGALKEPHGIISSYLAENIMHKVYSTDDSTKGKLAQTEYEVIKTSSHYSLLKINLLTGRKNQIRVHFADHGNPVAGDKKYGNEVKKVRRLTLHSTSLTIVHPHTKQSMTFETKMPDYFATLVRN
jgi:tRNA pseudouridine32 synthase/23S rRNA pseudouridine746 synthase/23S rRNA pseudouridine1911/1915/1917 synthase